MSNPLAYDIMLEETGCLESWDKSTIRYLYSNRDKVLKSIRGIIRVTLDEAEDIYADLLLYMYNNSDYDINKAYNSETGHIVSLEGYVNSCVKFSCSKFITAKYNRESMLVSEYGVEEKLNSLYEKIPDDKVNEEFEKVEYTLEDSLNCIEHANRKYRVDLFNIIYLKLLTLVMNKTENTYDKVLKLFGITSKQLSDIKNNLNKDPEIIGAIKVIANCKASIAIKILEDRYIHGFKSIRETIEQM